MSSESQDFEMLLARLDWQPAIPEAAGAVYTLAARNRWKEAVARARSAIEGGADASVMFLSLARGALAAGRPDRCLKSLEALGDDVLESREATDLRVSACMEAGDARGARVALESYLLRHMSDADAWARRRELAPGGPGHRGTDPLLSLRQAARVARAGYLERSARMLRRMLWECPGEPRLVKALERVEARLEQQRGRGD